MRIRTRCLKHPEATVYILEGTVKFQTLGSLQYVAERSERAELIELDEHNLYCTADDSYNHEIVFQVLKD